MKSLSRFILFILFTSVFTLSLSAFGQEDEIVFELKREEETKSKQAKRKKTLPEKFKRKSFSYSKDFVVFNERPKSNLKKGTVLRVNIPYPLIASFTEAFPVYGIIVSPFQGILSGEVKGVKNTNKAMLSFNETIIDGKVQSIQSFPVFLSGNLKESLFKDIALSFFESLPSALALALRAQMPQPQIHFINTDLKNKIGKLSVMETEKRKLLHYLELKNIRLLRIIIK